MDVRSFLCYRWSLGLYLKMDLYLCLHLHLSCACVHVPCILYLLPTPHTAWTALSTQRRETLQSLAERVGQIIALSSALIEFESYRPPGERTDALDAANLLLLNSYERVFAQLQTALAAYADLQSRLQQAEESLQAVRFLDVFCEASRFLFLFFAIFFALLMAL